MKRIATRASAAAVGLLVMAVAQPSRDGASARQAPAGQRPSFDVLEQTIPDLAAAMTAGTVTSQALVQAYLARIDAYDHQGPAINEERAALGDKLRLRTFRVPDPLSVGRMNDRVKSIELMRRTAGPGMSIVGIDASADVIDVGCDPGERWTVRDADHHSRVDYTLFEGRAVTGRVKKVFVRGQCIVDGTNWRGREGMGQYLRRGESGRA